ncbi:hypothetical protein DTL21_19325 [Bremerella cremea]|uniref:Uncharacterized protein n=1 Tax=Blastopirellula marina TaxID=124 RepID=A0A2S8FKB8_9BACT|nr:MULTISPECIES: hypothetical protein [Pirellulaceae]PQO32374.1 hypothetical protein C5Y83_19305 [Blastopirellula marina]RCS45441.1 hypothetical protein DTL21_19325 [Bremerella cremea]
MNYDQERKHVKSIFLGGVILDLALAILAYTEREESTPWFLIVLIGVIVSQVGICCALFLRNENLRENAIVWLVILLFLMAVGILVATQGDETGYLMLFNFGICLAVNTIPTLVVRWFFPAYRLQFSIVQIMWLTAAIGILAMLLRSAGMIMVWIVGILAVVTGPAALASFVLNHTHSSSVYYLVMSIATGIIGLCWICYPPMAPVFVFLMAQAVGSILGGSVVLRIKPDRILATHLADAASDSLAGPG